MGGLLVLTFSICLLAGVTAIFKLLVGEYPQTPLTTVFNSYQNPNISLIVDGSLILNNWYCLTEANIASITSSKIN